MYQPVMSSFEVIYDPKMHKTEVLLEIAKARGRYQDVPFYRLSVRKGFGGKIYNQEPDGPRWTIRLEI
jgi:hypothetical protein